MRVSKKGGTSYIVWTFNIMWYLIGFISAIDVYYAIKWREMLPQMEENPLGRMLIKYGADDISLFMGLKVAGTDRDWETFLSILSHSIHQLQI